jgi:hypothetical protein
MTEPVENSPEVKVGQAIRAMFAAMDELIALANTEETRTLVCNERIALGRILSHCETLCSFAMAVKPGPLLVRRVS